MSEQLQFPTRPDHVASPSLGDAGRVGEPLVLTVPGSYEMTEWRAERWRRRGIAVEVVQHGRQWVLVEA